MLGKNQLAASEPGDSKAVALDRELHDSSQPLSRLQCRLEIALLVGGEQVLLESVKGALEDVRLIIAGFDRLRGHIVRIRDEEVMECSQCR